MSRLFRRTKVSPSGWRLQYGVRNLLGRPVHRDLREHLKMVDQALTLEPGFIALSDADLTQVSARMMQEIFDAKDRQDATIHALALVRETARRALGVRAFDVQLVGAIAMLEGAIAEMPTGEGKTLSAVFVAYQRASQRRGVHMLTVNDYLARRDAEWMRPVYRLLGLDVGYVQEGMSAERRRAAYAQDVTYVTANECGFDYLRDNLVIDPQQLVQRPFHFALVDEIDSVLIDEARLPLVVAGGAATPSGLTEEISAMVEALKPRVDYDTDRYGRTVFLTEAGTDTVEGTLGCGNLFDNENLPLLTAVNQSLHAHVLVHRDIDYIVQEGRIELVDPFKGRVADRRRWPDGLQAAVEAKESLDISREARVLSTITVQDLMRLYPTVCGMTGTAATSADEFREFYALEVVVVPPNRPCIREDLPDIVYSSREAKWKGVCEDVESAHRSGRPVLVGTSNVRESEWLAAQLRSNGIACEILNAKNDADEAAIIAEAGSIGAVTISTNMAGRGTDIRVGGSDDADSGSVAALGGLYVIGTNRHESRRIDDQLRGRAGRQGDPGGSRFFVSVDDDLIVRYGLDRLKLPDQVRTVGGSPIDHPKVSRKIQWAQDLVEGLNFQVRVKLQRYQDIVEKQRRFIHRWRGEVLNGTQPSLLEQRNPEKYGDVVRLWGPDLMSSVERSLTLLHIDEGWADHLESIRELREGIHLRTRAKLDPVDEFRRDASSIFDKTKHEIEDAVVASFLAAEITEQGVDLAEEGLASSGATWTYLMGDTPHHRERHTFLEILGDEGQRGSAFLEN